MNKSSVISGGFDKILRICPSSFLAFPSDAIRGNEISKAVLLLQNITNSHVVFRILRDDTCDIRFKARPTMGIIKPNAMEKIEIIKKSENGIPRMSDIIYVEAFVANSGIDVDSFERELPTLEWKKIVGDNQTEHHGLLCYQTNCMSCVQLEQNVFFIDKELKTVQTMQSNTNARLWTSPIFLILVLMLLFTAFILWYEATLMNQINTSLATLSHCSLDGLDQSQSCPAISDSSNYLGYEDGCHLIQLPALALYNSPCNST